jgi:uncharacterized membrane protein
VTSTLQKAASGVLLTACAFFALHLLHAALAAFSAQNFLMSDYGVYTNTLYNLAHGNGFTFLVDQSYLTTHLSFSLILLTPLIWLLRTPTLLIYVQWMFLVGGCMVLFRIMQKRGVSLLLRSAILFFACAYPMTQSVMLSEFHGVSAYYLLLPWLLHEALFRRHLAVIPLAVILGLREDAGVVVLPMLVYLAVALKWRAGFILGGLAVLYAVLAVTVLYPLLNGVSLFDIRAMEASSDGILSAWDTDAMARRGRALLWLALPAIPFIVMSGRQSAAVLVFPLAALVTAMLSGMPRQHALAFHYPAPILAAMVCGVAFAARDRPDRQVVRYVAIAALLLVTITAHFLNGFFLGSRNAHAVYQELNARMKPLLSLARDVPREGLLVAHRKLAPYFSLRKDIMTWHYLDKEDHDIDLVVCSGKELRSHRLTWLRDAVRSGAYGVSRELAPYLLIQRGAMSTVNVIDDPPIYAALMLSHAGSIDFDRDRGLSRYWPGWSSKAPVTLAYGIPVALKAGSYEAVFRIRVESDTPAPEKGFGSLSVHPMNRDTVLARREAVPEESAAGFFDLAVPFTLDADMDVEPRVTGAGARLWVLSIRVRQLSADS